MENTNLTDRLTQLGITPQMVSSFLQGTLQADSISLKPKPRYVDTVPVWKEQITLGMTEQTDMRRWTQCRVWVKPPSQAFPTAAVFMSLVNAKGSVFVRLNTLAELEALQSAFSTWLPLIREKMESMKPLEAQYALAQQAYANALQPEEEG